MDNSLTDITDLSPEKSELLQLLLEEEGGDFDAFPLSFAQERLWFLDQLEPGNPLYNVPLALRLDGRLDRGALDRALTELARRHEALRTTFAAIEGRPVQIVAPAREFVAEQVDLGGLPPPERDAELRTLSEAEARKPFDLSAGPLWRALLVRLGDARHVLLLTLHHIVSDGWSMGVLAREANALYAAFSRGLPSPLAELDIQYADYAVWQREWLQGEALEGQLSYWRERLADAPPVLELPTDRPRLAQPRFRGASVPLDLSGRLTEGVKSLGRRTGSTPFMVLLAAWQTLLSRYTGQTDIAVGVPVANRQRQELEGLIGLFVNTLVLRADLSGSPTFGELLARVRETALGAYAHQDVPFEKLVEDLQPARSLSHTPLFQVLFNWQTESGPESAAPDLSLHLLPSDSGMAKFDLTLTMFDTPDGFRGAIGYSTELFDEATIVRLAGHFETLLDAAVREPEQPVTSLPLLTEPERRRLLFELNDTRRDYPLDGCVHELFEAQVQRTPEAVAVIYEGEQLTYAELNERANQLAHHLRGLGVGPESRVSVCMERSLEMVVGLLAVLKAGGAYVPLDPDYPAGRLSFMLEDAGVEVLLTQARLAGRLPGSGARVVRVDEESAALARESAENPPPGAMADNLVYVIYTSGSTGRPKGAMLHHRGLVNAIHWMQETHGLGEDDSFLLKTSLNFDPSVWEIFWTLSAGACVHVARPGGQLDAAYLADYISRHQITSAYFVPSMLRVFLDEPGAAECGSLRRVICGGEALPLETMRRFCATLPAALYHSYGPTEISITASAWRCEPEGGRRQVSIGYARANTPLYVLDDEMRPVPVGVTGELYVGGVGLGRGYLNRADLTAERFVPDPFSAEPGGRLYRTGDLVRRAADGGLEFVARADTQVKLRGFRIELGEIESAIAGHEDVSEAAVTVREEGGGVQRLVAYVVPSAGGQPSAAALRAHLKERLPEYMIPSAFVVLDALPLTPSGKVDRRALPAPDPARADVSSGYVAPRGATEEVLAGLWAEVLRVERVGVEDDFFELGGHSLLATRLVSRVRAAFRVELPLRALFESPTVAGLAAAVGRELRAGRGLASPPIGRAERAAALPLSFAQQRLWFLEQLSPGGAAYHIPAAVRLTGRLDARALEDALREVVRRHESLRTTFREAGGEPAQIVRDDPDFALPLIDLSALPEVEREAEARRLFAEESRRPFDLSAGPLVRAALARLGVGEHVLLLVTHHIVSDGWSTGVLVREVAALYEAFSAGRPSPLAELPIQYADYAVWQRELLRGGELERQLNYWRAQLAGAPPLELPTDRPRPPAQGFRGKTQAFTLPPELARRLQELSRREGVTMFMTLLAAFQTLLSRHSDQEDVVVGTPIAGRQQLETEGLIGFFVNTLALRSDLSGDPSFRELLKQVRETTLGAYAHQDVPFEKLVEELQPARDLSRPPLFQVMFVLQNADPAPLELPGLRLSAEPSEGDAAKFDLTLTVSETEAGLAYALNYDSDLFAAETAARLAGYFENLLGGIVADPDRPLSSLPLLPDAERRRLLYEWNDTARDYPSDLCVHELFERQAGRTPEAVAVAYEGERLTYAELNARANRLANHLIKLGVGPEVIVGVCLERSPEMVAALLAVLKAGGAYLPLDPEYPRERISFMLEDAGVTVLVTQQSLLDVLPGGETELVCVDRDWAAVARESAEDTGAGASADNLAYVIYTSGSTGRPKGVCIEHRSASAMLAWAHETFAREELASVLASTSVCFDLSVYELFAPLTCGGRVVLAENALQLPTLAAHGVTLVNTVPSAMAELMRSSGVPDSVLTVNLAGEPLKRSLVEEIYEGTKAARVWNLYGPSEDTTYSTFELVERGGEGAPSIGRPVHNTQLYVLDARGLPVPEGVAGELYLGGAGVSRGYLGRPDLTAERYVPDPFSGRPGARLYRTGDLARFLPDGRVDFLGRRDQQVKLRGFRIELGEIEATIASHEGVRECVAVVREDAGDDKRLVAYVVGAGETPGVSRLRDYLKARLPDYMIPSAFVTLGALPLTPNGKVDRKSLPAPEQSRPELASAFAAPRTATEELLCVMWAEVLRVGRVGVEDNFFELGGHSLLATKLVSRVRETFRVELPLRALFESPTVAGLAAAIERGLREGQDSQPPPHARAGRAEPPPLSFAQQRLWFLEQLSPGGAAYNVPVALRLRGRLDAASLGDALREVVRRHESLRTTFREAGGEPAQIVRDDPDFALPLIDLSALPEVERGAEARRLAREEARLPFDLARGPLWRAKLLRLGDEEHALLLTMHHIISDGWSMGVLVRETAAVYASLAAGETARLAELPIQYADYAVWQRELLRGGELERQLAYWREQLAGAQQLELPTDLPRPPVQTFRGKTHSFALGRELSDELKALGRREGVTLFMTLLAAFQTLLSRYTGQEDLVVGTPVAGRQRLETEGLIGFFVNTLVLRADLSGSPTFRELLGRVREATLGAYAHQDVPFEKLVEDLQPARDLSRPPLFQVMFVLQNAAAEPLELPGLRLSAMPADNETAKFDLTLTVSETEAGLTGALNYDSDLFAAETIARLAAHFETLLGGVVDDPDRPLASLPLLSDAERRRLLVEWNDTRRDYPSDLCVHELFERQAGRTPDAVAVVYEGESLSYEELNARANQLAHHLRGLGVGPDSLVGVFVERSLEMVVGLLAVLKAGGAYLPLDPEYPQERVAYMLADAGARVLLTQRRLAGLLPEHGARVVLLDDCHALASKSRENPPNAATADSLAYVIYTSGSTGRPKGAMLAHRGVVNRLLWMQEEYGLTGADRVLQKTPFGFDVSVWEFFWPLLAGARLVFARPGGHQDAPYLVSLIKERGVTVLHFVPPMLRAFLQADGVEGCVSLRLVVCSGEALPHELQARFFARLGARLDNLYGPTEASVDVTYWRCRGDSGETSVPIGRPVSNTRVYVLDKNLNPVPAGAAGELYLGGVQLARGYLNRPDLTAERFVPDPFSADAGARLYRTGDLARWRGDGNVEYLGRLDHQVKLRGFRIELGEIEAAIASHEGVRECVAVVREDAGDDKRLVAYVVGGGETPSVSRLRAHLKERLPEYMIPSAFVTLDELPLTPNGKLDRLALPAPGQSRPELESAYAAPRNATEELLCVTWAEVLRVGRVGVRDNFFELGGHSLLATKLVSRVREAFRVELPLRALFESPTVAGLAAEVERRRLDGGGSQTPPLVRAGRAERPPLSFAQQRLWFLEQLAPGGAAYNVPVALRLRGRLDAALLERALVEVARRHEALRTTFGAAAAGVPVQFVAEETNFELLSADLSALPEVEREAEARRLAREEARLPFDLARGPLWRAKLVRLGDEEHTLLLTMHHIVSDGWSLDVLVRETAALYEAFSAGRPSPLAELPIQYADYAVWQRELLRGGELERQLNYWRAQLAGAPPLELPTDLPRPPVQTFRGAAHSFALGGELSDELKALGRREGVTLFMTLLAAFQTLLSRYAGQEDVVVGTPVAGRQRLETEGLIGFFVNTLVLRADLSGAPSFRELLGRVRESALGAYAHQDVPFEKLVEELQPARDLSRPPLFQVMFALQNAPGDALELPGLRLSVEAAGGETAKFDLTLAVSETEAGLACALNYNADLFKGETAARLAGYFENLLGGIVADPDRPLSSLPLLPDAERRRLLYEWNDTRRDRAPDRCAHELFEAQVRLTPDAEAVVCGDERLSYAELNERANRLAHHLIKLGVGPDSVVGVFAGRSAGMVAALLAVLKAGGAYLPLDPEYPRERLRFMLEDARARVLLTETRLIERLPEHDSQIVRLDDRAPLDGESVENPRGAATADSLAYVIYTSGSTGRPKGVAVEHRALLNLVAWHRRVYEVKPSDRATLVAGQAFDASVWELWPYLAAGASLRVPAEETRASAAALVEWLAAEGVTICFLPTPLAEAALEEDWPAGLSLRCLLTGGDALRRRPPAGAPFQFFNHYGPTENTVVATAGRIEADADAATTIHIGRPIDNAEVYLLDAHSQPVPLGAAGELCIGGAGLARGYLHRQELTAERFVPDAFSGRPGARLYRTGDLARYLPDGRLDFLGRLDQQVKIRGYRIELGEIESALVELAGVRECVVEAREDGGDGGGGAGRSRLVAYVAAGGGAGRNVSELRARLRERLPEYMIPSAFVFLDALPLTPNGKVDRRALPHPGSERPGLDRQFVEPRNEVEAGVAALWAEVLGVERVGVEDDFFELGGHSLLATQLVARVRETFGVELPLRLLFESPTVAGLSVAVIQKQSEQLDGQELERLLAELEQSPD